MIMSLAVQEKAQQAVGKLAADARTRLLNASVQLAGPPSGGGTFDGSGVIAFVREEKGTDTAWILTAKHNLYIWEGKKVAPAWSDDLVKGFTGKVQIRFGAKMAFGVKPDQTAAISVTVPIDNQRKSGPWAYDVMVVKSSDKKLVDHARENAVYLHPWEMHQKFLTNPLVHLRRSQDGKPVTFVQTGFGKITMTVNETPLPTETRGQNEHHKLQYRVTTPLDGRTTTVYSARGKGSDYDVFEEAIVLRSSANDGTAPGDSGGPLYLVDPRNDSLQLVGVTTGGDLPTTKINPYPKPPEIAANNIATSLAVFYASIPK